MYNYSDNPYDILKFMLGCWLYKSKSGLSLEDKRRIIKVICD